MKYLEVIENLQKQNENYVVLMQSGIFFIAIGKDAVFLNKKIGLKLTCMKKGLCKVRLSSKKFRKIYTKTSRKGYIFCNIYI